MSKKDKKLTPQQKRKQIERARAKRLENSPENIKRIWLTLFRPATRRIGPFSSRVCWGGVPTLDSNDPFCLVGMELLLIWYPSEEDKLNFVNGEPVSSFTIDQYMGEFAPEQVAHRVHEYEITVMQLVAADSEYGRMLAAQRNRGLLSEAGDVLERKLRILFAAGPLPQKDRAIYIANDVEPIDHGLLTIVVPYLRRSEGDQLKPGEALLEGTAQNQLSDLEIDRLWELTAFIAAWLYSPKENAVARHERKQTILTQKEKLRTELEQNLAKLAELQGQLDELRVEISASSEKAEGQLAQFEMKKRALELELIEARAALSHQENEISRLAGVFRQKFREVTQAVRSHGANSSECRDLQRAAEHSKSKHDTAVAEAKTAELRLEELKAGYDARVLKLQRELASERAIPAGNVLLLERRLTEMQTLFDELSAQQLQLAAELAKTEGVYGIYTSL